MESAMTNHKHQTAFYALRAPIIDLPTQNIADLAKSAFGRDDVIPLWFGEGDMGTPDFIKDAASRALAEGHTFYTFQNGIPELRDALSDYLGALHQRPIERARISVTTGGMGAMLLAIELTVGEGDNVVVVDPVWPNINGAVRIMGGHTRSVRMSLGNDGWQLDLERLKERCDKRTRAIFFASPGNPTGWIMPREQQQALLDFARQRGLWLISDEVYSRLAFDRPAAPSFLEIIEPEDRVFVVNSFSKSWSMTGWRMGWLVHPPSLENAVAQVVQYTTSGTTTFLQHAGVAAISNGADYIRQMTEHCRIGRDIVFDVLEKLPRVRYGARPQGAMYAFFTVEGEPDARKFCAEILQKTGVGLAPGFNFGPGAEDFIRLCFCRSHDQLREAMSRLEGILR
jgi:aspartate/methionine/tyrosine aminotransferase